jgi:hypothetical protein
LPIGSRGVAEGSDVWVVSVVALGFFWLSKEGGACFLRLRLNE